MRMHSGITYSGKRVEVACPVFLKVTRNLEKDRYQARGYCTVKKSLEIIMQRAPQPSCFDRVKVGFMMGFAIGMSSAALFGTYSALKYGLRGRELVSSIGKIMLQGGGTFGVFMSVGTAIRC